MWRFCDDDGDDGDGDGGDDDDDGGDGDDDDGDDGVGDDDDEVPLGEMAKLSVFSLSLFEVYSLAYFISTLFCLRVVFELGLVLPCLFLPFLFLPFLVLYHLPSPFSITSSASSASYARILINFHLLQAARSIFTTQKE